MADQNLDKIRELIGSTAGSIEKLIGELKKLNEMVGKNKTVTTDATTAQTKMGEQYTKGAKTVSEYVKAMKENINVSELQKKRTEDLVKVFTSLSGTLLAMGQIAQSPLKIINSLGNVFKEQFQIVSKYEMGIFKASNTLRVQSAAYKSSVEAQKQYSDMVENVFNKSKKLMSLQDVSGLVNNLTSSFRGLWTNNTAAQFESIAGSIMKVAKSTEEANRMAALFSDSIGKFSQMRTILDGLGQGPKAATASLANLALLRVGGFATRDQTAVAARAAGEAEDVGQNGTTDLLLRREAGEDTSKLNVSRQLVQRGLVKGTMNKSIQGFEAANRNAKSLAFGMESAGMANIAAGALGALGTSAGNLMMVFDKFAKLRMFSAGAEVAGGAGSLATGAGGLLRGGAAVAGGIGLAGVVATTAVVAAAAGMAYSFKYRNDAIKAAEKSEKKSARAIGEGEINQSLQRAHGAMSSEDKANLAEIQQAAYKQDIDKKAASGDQNAIRQQGIMKALAAMEDYDTESYIAKQNTENLSKVMENLSGTLSAGAGYGSKLAEVHQTIAKQTEKSTEIVQQEIVRLKAVIAAASEAPAGESLEEQKARALSIQTASIELTKKENEVMQNQIKMQNELIASRTAEFDQQLKSQSVTTGLAEATRNLHQAQRMGMGQDYDDMIQNIQSLSKESDIWNRKAKAQYEWANEAGISSEEKTRRTTIAEESLTKARQTETKVYQESQAMREGYLQAFKAEMSSSGGYAELAATSLSGIQNLASSQALGGFLPGNNGISAPSKFTVGGFQLGGGTSFSDYSKQGYALNPNMPDFRNYAPQILPGATGQVSQAMSFMAGSMAGSSASTPSASFASAGGGFSEASGYLRRAAECIDGAATPQKGTNLGTGIGSK